MLCSSLFIGSIVILLKTKPQEAILPWNQHIKSWQQIKEFLTDPNVFRHVSGNTGIFLGLKKNELLWCRKSHLLVPPCMILMATHQTERWFRLWASFAEEHFELLWKIQYYGHLFIWSWATDYMWLGLNLGSLYPLAKLAKRAPRQTLSAGYANCQD